jgi:hypothetical protein
MLDRIELRRRAGPDGRANEDLHPDRQFRRLFREAPKFGKSPFQDLPGHHVPKRPPTSA